MGKQLGFFDVDRRLDQLAKAGDPLLALARVVDFELFRAAIEAATRFSDRPRRPATLSPPHAISDRVGARRDAVLMLKVFVLQALYGLANAAAECQSRDRLSYQRLKAELAAEK